MTNEDNGQQVLMPNGAKLHHVKGGDVILLEGPDGNEYPVVGLIVQVADNVPALMTAGTHDPISLLAGAMLQARGAEMEMQRKMVEAQRSRYGGRKGLFTPDGFHPVG